MATRVRDWATVDYYALLGVDPGADAETVTRAYREQAKQWHPDATADAAAAERFHDVAAAYAVLGDRRMRREYDRVRAEVRPVVPAGPAPAPRPPAGPRRAKPWTRRKALAVMISGVLLTVLGIGAAGLTWSMHEHDARQRARFVPVVAARLPASGYVSFVTKSGERVRVPEPRRHGDPSGLGPTTKIRYDPANPEHVIVDDTSTARDITFAIVALKLLVGGPVFTAYGARRLRAVTAAR
jgi:curved DNA-binding protein CbpA